MVCTRYQLRTEKLFIRIGIELYLWFVVVFTALKENTYDDLFTIYLQDN